MKMVWCGVLVAVGATLAWSESVNAGDGEKCKTKIFVRHTGDGAEGGLTLVEFKGDGSDGDVKVRCFDSRGGDHQRINLARFLREVEDDKASANSGWLGVQLSISRTSDNGDESTELVVSNVAEDSAAAEAGFERNDLIIEVDDEAIDGEMGALIDAIRDAGPGKRIKFTVLRDGERQTLVATLGRRGDAGEVSWIYKNEAGALFRESTDARFRVLLRGEDGSWTMEHLAKLGGLHGALAGILPDHLGRTMSIMVDGDETSISTSVTRDGVTISVEREGDGEIVVTRHRDGRESVERYADEDALQAGDEEASEIFRETQTHMIMTYDGGLHGAHGGMFEFKLDGDFDWLENIEETLDLKGRELVVLYKALDDLRNIEIDVDTDAPHFAFFHGQARRTILENADGSIDVTVRRGGDELITRYTDADDLRERDPKMYQRYENLRSADIDD